MKKSISCLLLVGMCFSNLAHAFLTTRDALSWLEGDALHKEVANSYIGGMAEAHYWQSIMAKRHGKGVICFPDKQALQTEELQLLAVLSLKKRLNEMERDSAEEKEFLDNALSFSLMFTWMREFPCK